MSGTNQEPGRKPSLLAVLDSEFGLGPPQEDVERRGSGRRHCAVPAVLVPADESGRLDEAGRRDGIVVDVSESGLRLISRNLESVARMEVRIPRLEGDDLVVSGTVVRTRELDRGYREYGLARCDLSAEGEQVTQAT